MLLPSYRLLFSCYLADATDLHQQTHDGGISDINAEYIHTEPGRNREANYVLTASQYQLITARDWDRDTDREAESVCL